LFTSLNGEFTRRSKTPTYSAYTVTPATANNVLVEHASKLFANVKAMDATRNYTINANNIVMTSDLTNTISYIQTLMNQNLST
jgi:hypothetical protein